MNTVRVAGGTLSAAAVALLGLAALRATAPISGPGPPTPPPITAPATPAAAPSPTAPRIDMDANTSALMRSDGVAIEPDPQLTPGAVLTTDAATVARPGYAGSVRSVSADTKNGRFAAYHVFPTPGQAFEIDHLISLELGGSNDPANLWPEPYFGPWNAHDKDALENRLHELVVSGKLTLPAAQTAIRSDWIGAYRQYVSPSGPPSAQVTPAAIADQRAAMPGAATSGPPGIPTKGE